jgi:protoheme IX farnesyltransferase
LGYFGAAYGIVSVVAGLGMLWCAINVYRKRDGAAALRASRQLFAFSIVYLFALFATLLVEAMVPAIGKMVG